MDGTREATTDEFSQLYPCRFQDFTIPIVTARKCPQTTGTICSTGSQVRALKEKKNLSAMLRDTKLAATFFRFFFFFAVSSPKQKQRYNCSF